MKNAKEPHGSGDRQLGRVGTVASKAQGGNAMKIFNGLGTGSRLLARRPRDSRGAGRAGAGFRSLLVGFRGLHRSGEEGGSLVEMAVVLPLLLLLTTGILTFGIAISNDLQLTEAVSSGARVIAVSRGNTLDPCNTAVTSTAQAAPGLAQANMTFTLVLNTGTNTYTYGPTQGSLSCSSASITTGPPSYMVQGGTATLTVTYPCNLAVYGRNYAPNCVLTAQTTEAVQ